MTQNLPLGWEERVSKSTGYAYYYNRLDGTSTWNRPTAGLHSLNCQRMTRFTLDNRSGRQDILTARIADAKEHDTSVFRRASWRQFLRQQLGASIDAGFFQPT
eukprot:754261-Hanusia_phi.AAC.6